MNKDIIDFTSCKRIAIMGGTFDPIHYGHLVTAEAVRDEFNIERVLFIPTGLPPHKENSRITSNEHRYLMAMLATIDNPFFCVSRLEIDRPGKTYTIDTIRAIHQLCPKETKIYFITGADAIAQILTWKDAEQLLGLCSFIAVTRPGFNKESVLEHIADIKKKYASRLHFLEVPALAISSTDIRNRVRIEKPIKYLLPEEVENYIEKHELYKEICFQNAADEVKRYLKSVLQEKRYMHTLRVAKEAVQLAAHYGYDKDKAYLAALLHDCAKDIANEDKKRMCKRYGLKLDPVMKKQTDLVHSFLGAEIARRVFCVEDEDILNAVRYHTTGRANMSLLEKIISLADAIEPGRGQYTDVIELRKLAYDYIDKAMLLSLHCKEKYSRGKSRIFHPLGIDALAYYKKQVEDGGI